MCLRSFSQVPDSQNNNYVAWETMIINHKPGNCFCYSALWESILLRWKEIIYLGPEKKPRSPRAPSGYCITECHGIAAGERLPLAVINPCVLDCLRTRHPLGHPPLGSRAIVLGLLSQMEGLLELRSQALQASCRHRVTGSQPGGCSGPSQLCCREASWIWT